MPVSGGPGSLRITPSISLGESFNDNVNLVSQGQESAWITTITPSIAAADNAERLKLNLNYQPSGQFYLGGVNTEQFQQNLIGAGQAIFIPDQLFLNATASINQVFLSPTGAIGATNLTTNSNLQSTQAYSVSPDLKHHFGSFADSDTSYRYSYVTTSGGSIAPLATNEAKQVFTGGEDFDRLGWTLTGDVTRDTEPAQGNALTSNVSFKDEYVRADPKYAIYRGLDLTAGIGWEHVAGSFLTIPPYEIIWDAGFILNPRPNATLTLTYGRRYGGTDVEVDGKWDVGPRTHLSVTYSKEIQNSQSLIGSQLGCIYIGASGQLFNCAGVPVLNAQGAPETVTNLPIGFGGGFFGIPISPLGFSNSPFVASIFSATASHTFERDTYGLSLNYQNNDVQVPPESEKVYYGALYWTHNLRRDITSSLSGTFGRTLVSNPGGSSSSTSVFGGSASGIGTYYALTAGLTYTLARDATASLNFTRSTSRSVGQQAVNDDVITASFTKQF